MSISVTTMATTKDRLLRGIFIFGLVSSLSETQIGTDAFKVTVTQVYGVLNDSAILRCSHNMKTVQIYGVIWRKAKEFSIIYEYWNRGNKFVDKAFDTSLITVTGFFRPQLGYHDLEIKHPTHAVEIGYHCELYGLLGQKEVYDMEWLHLDLIVPPKALPTLFSKEGGKHGDICGHTEQVQVIHVPAEWVILICHAYPSKPSGVLSWSRGKHLNTTHTKEDGNDMFHIWSTVNVTREKVAAETVHCTIAGPDLQGKIGKTSVCIILDWKKENTIQQTIIERNSGEKFSLGHREIGIMITFAIIFAVIVWGLITCFNKHHVQRYTRNGVSTTSRGCCNLSRATTPDDKGLESPFCT